MPGISHHLVISLSPKIPWKWNAFCLSSLFIPETVHARSFDPPNAKQNVGFCTVRRNIYHQRCRHNFHNPLSCRWKYTAIWIQWRTQEFPGRGRQPQRWEYQSIIWQHFCWKLRENERNLTEGVHVSGTLFGSSNGDWLYCSVTFKEFHYR